MLLMLWTMVCLLALTACGLGVFHAQESEAASSPSEETGGAVTTEGVELTLQFSFGERTGIYSGGMKDGLPDGQGTFESRNETGTAWVYEGGWEMGHLKGQGTTTFESGYRETGWYEGDNLNGQGKLYQDEILIYEGAFTDNIPDGQGTLYSMCGEAIYSGSFAYGFIDETEEARDARLSAFKAASGEQDYGALLESAQNGGDAHTKLSGTVYYLFEPDEQGYGCSFLLEMADGISCA
jgi:hypothetical protein